MDSPTTFVCPRTSKAFTDKIKYVAHLKTLALKGLCTNDNHVRVQIFKRKFEELRKTARSFDDVISWFKAHERLMGDLSVRIKHLPAKLSKTKSRFGKLSFTIDEYTWFCSNIGACPTHGVRNDEEDPAKPYAYIGVVGTFSYTQKGPLCIGSVLKEYCPHIHLWIQEFYDSRYNDNFKMFAEDWPFIGAHFLF